MSLRDEALAGTGVRQAVQRFWKGSSVLRMQLSGEKLTKSVDCLDWTVQCVPGAVSVQGSQGSFILPIHALYFRFFHSNFENSQISAPRCLQGELVQVTFDPSRGVGLS